MKNTRKEFLLTFFKEDKYQEKEVNGFWLVKSKDSSSWQVGIYTQESFKKYQEFKRGNFAKTKKKKLHAGDLCRKCQTPIIYKESKFKMKKLLKHSYYTGYYYCPKCKTMYMSEEFKVIVKDLENKFNI